ALNARRARSDDSDALPGKVDFLLGPLGGLIPVSLEFLQPLVFGGLRNGEAACRQDAIAGRDRRTRIGLDAPPVCVFIKVDGRDARSQLDIGPKLETIGDVVEIPQNLGLGSVALGPTPLVLQLFGEGVGILQAFDVAAGAGIAIPEPRASY